MDDGIIEYKSGPLTRLWFWLKRFATKIWNLISCVPDHVSFAASAIPLDIWTEPLIDDDEDVVDVTEESGFY